MIDIRRQEKAVQRLWEDIELEIRLLKLDLKISKIDPISKAVSLAGGYPDFLVARKVGERKGWSLTREV